MIRARAALLVALLLSCCTVPAHAGPFGHFREMGSAPLTFNFAPLSLGANAAATVLSATGLAFTRTTTATTCQTSATTIVSGVNTDVACVGSNGSAAGLVIQPRYVERVAYDFNGDVRNLNAAGWTAGTAVVTSNYGGATSPSGDNGSSRVNGASASYSPYSNVGGQTVALPTTWEAWQRSVSSSEMQTCYQNQVLGTGTCVRRAGSTTWARLRISRTGPNVAADVMPSDQRDNTGNGGDGAQARDVVVDYVALHMGIYEEEASSSAQIVRTPDRLTYSGAAPIATSGRVRMYGALFPRWASTNTVYFDDNLGSGAAQAGFYFWSYGGAGNNRAYLDQATHKIAAVVAGSAPCLTANAMAWSENDFVETFFEVGAAVASTAKYRLNGGAWTDLAWGGCTMAAITPPGTTQILGDDRGTDNTDGGAFGPARWKEIRFYGPGGTP